MRHWATSKTTGRKLRRRCLRHQTQWTFPLHSGFNLPTFQSPLLFRRRDAHDEETANNHWRLCVTSFPSGRDRCPVPALRIAAELYGIVFNQFCHAVETGRQGHYFGIIYLGLGTGRYWSIGPASVRHCLSMKPVGNVNTSIRRKLAFSGRDPLSTVLQSRALYSRQHPHNPRTGLGIRLCC
ncbi:hypothetical protein ACN47E_003109 [Coniothyrium glycines]